MVSPLLNDLFAIWKAGVVGVAPDRLIQGAVQYDSNGNSLWIHDEEFSMQNVGRIVVVGAGKASGAMAAALERQILPFFDRKRLLGWVNVPEDCISENATQVIHLHAARPAGINEPTFEGVYGTQKIWELLRCLQPNDLCFCLISGGGSALLPAPIPEITLEEKRDLTRFLSLSGANIEELNTVRKHLSLIKGGGIRRLCAGKHLITFILSDVLGDPLDLIASGPTVADTTTAQDALNVLRKYGINENSDKSRFAPIYKILLRKTKQRQPVFARNGDEFHRNIVLGNNAVAVDAAGVEAEKRGFSHAMLSAEKSEGAAENVGIHLLEQAGQMLQNGPLGPNCLISGGEPTVRLPQNEQPGKGGRNQHLILAALLELLKYRARLPNAGQEQPLKFAMLSAGTDGEDGPTDAAGAYFDDAVFQNILHLMQSEGLNPQDYLQRCDSYHFFERVGGLFKTGPTGTNVCDLRIVALTDR